MNRQKNSVVVQEVRLPELGEGVLSGELVKYLKKEGDPVEVDSPLAEVMTDKAAMEVPSPARGHIKDLMIKEGDTVEVGQVLLTLKVRGGEDKKGAGEPSQSVSREGKEALQMPEPPPAEAGSSPGRSLLITEPSFVDETRGDRTQKIQEDPEGEKNIKASPLTRRLAQKLGISLRHVKGTGLSGRITKEDIEKHHSLPWPGPADLKGAWPAGGRAGRVKGMEEELVSVPVQEGQERKPLKGIRKKIAQKMQLSKRVIPHFTLMERASLQEVERIRNSVKESLKDQGVKITYLVFVMRALLKTVLQFPELNASMDDKNSEIVLKKYYHFGFACDTPRGLLVPVIKNVDKKSVTRTSQEIQDLAQKARTGRIKPEDMSGGTLTITNIGSLGGQFATPIINPPETAILGMYRLSVEPCWDGVKFQPQKVMNFSLTCDHRLIDGGKAARALKFFVQTLEQPFVLFI